MHVLLFSETQALHALTSVVTTAWVLARQAQVEQWIDFTTTELDAPLLSWILPLLGHWPYDKKVLQSRAHCTQHNVPGQLSPSPDVVCSPSFQTWSVRAAWLQNSSVKASCDNACLCMRSRRRRARLRQ